MKTSSRRAFLKLAADSLIGLSGILSLGGLIRYLSYEMDPAPPSEYDLGPLDDFPPGSRALLMHIPAVLFHTHEGLTAFSLTCTHLGCTVEFANGQYECPCHGSRYDENGFVMRGPSSKPLKKLKAEVNEENHIILRMN